MNNRESSPTPDGGGAATSAPPGRAYESLVKAVEGLFETHGDSHQGLGYPKPDGFYDRYRVFLDVMKLRPEGKTPVKVLDVGCATGCVLDEIKASGLGH